MEYHAPKIMKTTGKVQQYAYTLTYRRGARRIVLRYDVHGALHASAPYYTPKLEVERFILLSLPKLEKMKKPEASWQSGMELTLSGERVRLAFDEQAGKPYVLEGKLFVQPGSRDEVSGRVKRYFHDTTRNRVVPLVAWWCRELGLTVGRIAIRDSHRVWASCSRKGNLNFSLRCAGLGDEDLSYLVLHELDHRVNFNHGPQFHAFLDRHMPDWRLRERQLSVMQPKCDVFGGR